MNCLMEARFDQHMTDFYWEPFHKFGTIVSKLSCDEVGKVLSTEINSDDLFGE